MKILSNHNRLVDIVDLQVAYITSSNNAGHEKTISGREANNGEKAGDIYSNFVI